MSHRKNLGKSGEDFACRYLETNGYQIEARNVRTKEGEIDIVGWENNQLIFFEVKTKKSSQFVRPEEGYSFRQRGRLRKMAKYYLYERSPGRFYSAVRFDFIGITFRESKPEILHLKNVDI
ncbi:MAG TPA: YraN family protein [Bdellovibrionota bacterium]|nr:YraN family protein [Bdellovibrionota bacterium]